MTMISGRRGAKELERQERRVQRDEREHAAGKLVSKVPDLTRLDIAIFETSPKACSDDSRYVRRIVVENAPALFEVPCGARCEGGGYDVTREFLAALSSHSLRFEGQQTCRGQCRDADCARVLRYVATAMYRENTPQTGPTVANERR